MTDIKQLTGLMVLVTKEAMAWHMATSTLRELLGCEPGVLEVLYYLGEPWLEGLAQWRHD